MNKLHRSRYINVVVSMMMAFLMLAAMGTTQVHAAQYTTGTIDPAELKAGDVVYRGVQLTVDRQIVVCKKCNMIWITTGTDYGTGDVKRSEVVATEAHKDHPDKVGYSEFNWYFNLDSSGPLLKNTPFTIVENANIKYKITYNTNGGTCLIRCQLRRKMDMILPAGIQMQILRRLRGRDRHLLPTRLFMQNG